MKIKTNDIKLMIGFILMIMFFTILGGGYLIEGVDDITTRVSILSDCLTVGFLISLWICGLVFITTKWEE